MVGDISTGAVKFLHDHIPNLIKEEEDIEKQKRIGNNETKQGISASNEAYTREQSETLSFYQEK